MGSKTNGKVETNIGIGTALTIAGSDMVAGAGIQADLKVFCPWRVWCQCGDLGYSTEHACGYDGRGGIAGIDPCADCGCA